MLHAYFLKPALRPADVARELPQKALAVDPALASLPKFLSYTLSQTFKAFLSGQATARKFEVEWLCRLACTPQIEQGLQMTAFKDRAGIASVEPIPKTRLEKWGTPLAYRFTPAEKKRLARLYHLPDSVVRRYGLEELLIEKSAVAFLG